jgi:RHS repeat-associated protein
LVDTPQPTGEGQFKIVSQEFDYDTLNRLDNVHEGTNWKQEYVYDRFGNRKIHQTHTTGDSIPKPNYGVDPVTNRLTAPSGSTMTYDAAGNLTYDTTNGSQGDRVFDAENRMTAAKGIGAAWQYYVYDGEGKRIRRNITAGETWQVYGIGGELIAEYTSSGTQLSKEYGYRNGQLLITAAVASVGWGTPPTIEDNPLKNPDNPESYKIKSIHITQLRTAINALRAHLNKSQYSWTTSANPGDWVTADPILEMRIAVDQALGPPSTTYTPELEQHKPILAAHIQELRKRVLDAWNSGTSGTDVRWLVADQLGTPRIILDASGGFSNVTRHDYLPFGEELVAGGRTWDHGYTFSDVNRQKFTGYESDDETDLDYAQARYHSSGQGRFTSPDPASAGADAAAPQSWNGYSYVMNNPLNFVDPLGMDPQDPKKPGRLKRAF